MVVSIPKIRNGMFTGEIISVKISDNCCVCGKKRGDKRWGYVDFFGRQIRMNRWDNECGHRDKYSDLFLEAVKIKRGRHYHNQKSANNYLKQEKRRLYVEKQEAERIALEERIRIEKENKIIEQKLLEDYEVYLKELRTWMSSRLIRSRRSGKHLFPKGLGLNITESKSIARTDITDECSHVNGLFKRNYIDSERTITDFFKLYHES